MKSFRLSAFVLATAAVLAGPASAVPISVAFNFVPLGTTTANTGDVTTATTMTNNGLLVVGQIVSNNINLVTMQSVFLSPNPMGVTLGSIFTKTFTTSFGTFVESLTVNSVAPSANSLGVTASGLITQTSGTGFDPTQVFYSASYTQNQGPGAQINASYNDSTIPPRPPTGGPLPEPATLALLGLGILGFAASRRKSAK